MKKMSPLLFFAAVSITSTVNAHNLCSALFNVSSIDQVADAN